jgi:hypothetical protein
MIPSFVFNLLEHFTSPSEIPVKNAPQLCSSIMLLNYAPQLCSSIMLLNYAPQLCSSIMLLNYAPQLSRQK